MATIGVLIIMVFLLNGVLGQYSNCGRNCVVEDEDAGGSIVVVIGIIVGIAILCFFCGGCFFCRCTRDEDFQNISENSGNSQAPETSITIEPLPYNPTYYGNFPVAPITANAPVENDLPSYDEVTHGNYI